MALRSDRWTDAYLQRMRLAADPEADRTVAELFASGAVDAIHVLPGTLARGPGDAGGTPAVLAAYLEGTGRTPSWSDPDRLRTGQEVFLRHGPLCLLSLIAAALPECYGMRDGVRVLAATQKLRTHAYRRIYETAQLVVRVMSPGGLSAGGTGIVALQRVRLVHAAIRHLLRQPPQPPGAPGAPTGLDDVLRAARWDPAWGLPVNQEDLAGTLTTFSWVVLRSLERLGVELSDEEREGYHHCWAVAGSLIGIEDPLLPGNVSEAETLFERWRARQQAASEDGRQLTRAVLETLGRVLDDVLPMSPLGRRLFPPMLVRTLLDPPTSDLLGVSPLGRVQRAALWLIRPSIERIADLRERGGDRVLVLRLAQRVVGRALVEHLTRIPQAWQRDLFEIPTSLQESWRRPV